MLPRSFISLTLATLLSGCAASLPYTPSRLTNGIDRDAVQLNDAHTRATNGVITMNILRARDGWPTGYTTLSGVQFNPDVELDLTGNFTPLGLGNAPYPLAAVTLQLLGMRALMPPIRLILLLPKMDLLGFITEMERKKFLNAL